MTEGSRRRAGEGRLEASAPARLGVITAAVVGALRCSAESKHLVAAAPQASAVGASVGAAAVDELIRNFLPKPVNPSESMPLV